MSLITILIVTENRSFQCPHETHSVAPEKSLTSTGVPGKDPGAQVSSVIGVSTAIRLIKMMY